MDYYCSDIIAHVLTNTIIVFRIIENEYVVDMLSLLNGESLNFHFPPK